MCILSGRFLTFFNWSTSNKLFLLVNCATVPPPNCSPMCMEQKIQLKCTAFTSAHLGLLPVQSVSEHRLKSCRKKSSTQQISVLFIHVQPVTRDSSQSHCITLNKQKFAPHRGPCPQHANKVAYLSTVGQDCSHHEAEDANCSDRFLHLDFFCRFFLVRKNYIRRIIYCQWLGLFQSLFSATSFSYDWF